MGCDEQFQEPRRLVKDRGPRIETTVFPPSAGLVGTVTSEKVSDKTFGYPGQSGFVVIDAEEKKEDPGNKERPPLTEFEQKLKSLLNRYSQENMSATPDFILAEYMIAALHAFNRATRAREHWYGRRVF